MWDHHVNVLFDSVESAILDLLQLAFENTCRILLTQSGLYQLKQLKTTKKEWTQTEVGGKIVLHLLSIEILGSFWDGM